MFSGLSGLTAPIYDAYEKIIGEEEISSTINDCFNETPVYALNKKYSPNSFEEQHARHLSDIDLLELFCLCYIRNHRNYKYNRGKTDTADKVVQVLADNGIYLSKDKYNSWRRTTGYRIIDDTTLSLLLELLEISPDNFKRLIFLHIALQRKAKETENSDDILFSHYTIMGYLDSSSSMEEDDLEEYASSASPFWNYYSRFSGDRQRGFLCCGCL